MIPDEVQLIQRAKRGDPAALNTLLTRYVAFVHRVAERIVRNSTDAADITQEVLLKIVAALPALEAVEKFQSWVYRITYRTSLNWLRALHRRSECSEQEVVDWSAGEEANKLVGEEHLAQMHAALQTLPYSQRIVIKLFYFEERPVSEVAKILGLSEGTVKVQLHRIRKALWREMINAAASG